MRAIPLLCSFLLPVLCVGETVPPPEEKPAEETEAAEDTSDSDTEALSMLQVQVEWIEVPHETLTGLLFMRPKGNADATGLRKEVQELVKAGKGKILETQIITGRGSEKCTVESVHELMYPTTFEPAEIPNNVTTPDKQEVAHPENAKSLAGLITPHTPSDFQRRDVGSALEIVPSVDRTGKIIGLRLTPDLDWLAGRTLWQERKDILGNLLKMEEPEFYSLRATTALTMKDGSYALAAVLSPKNQEGHADMDRKVMMFVKADVLAVE